VVARSEQSAKKAAFFDEAEGYRADFSDHAYFVAIARSGGYYFNDATKTVSFEPRYVLNPNAASDSWFYNWIKTDEAYNINVNVDTHLKVTQVWMNIVVRDAAGVGIGLTGASLNLNSFLDVFVRSGATGVTPMVIDLAGAIQAHPDDRLIAYNSGASGERAASTIYTLMPRAADQVALHGSMQRAFAQPSQVETLWATLRGKRQLVAVAYIPELRWYVLTALDMSAAQVLDPSLLWSAGAGLALLIALLLLGFGLAVERLVLHPLQRLQASARAMADGRYDVTMPREGVDEIGDLSRAFNLMATKVRSHTSELESCVQQRTLELQ
jgi:HAMP domain-containing protein